MSDPAKSASEIEDVLDSIRRLVSESHVAPAPAAARSVAQPARLVLTPAHRVSEPDDPWAPVPVTERADGAGQGADSAQGTDDNPAWGLEDRLSDWGEIEDSAQEAIEDAIAEQSGDDHRAPAPFAVLGEAGRHSDGSVIEGAGPTDFESETGDTDWPDPGATRALRDLALVRGQPEADPGDDTAQGADPEPSGQAPDAWAEDTAAPADDAMTGAAEAGGAEPVLEGEPDAAAPEGHGPVFARRFEVHRPAAPAADAPDAELEDRSDAAPEDWPEHPDDGPEIEDLGEATQPFTFPETEEGLLDEDTLREIIADVVRQELQGVLGQRITRNVRKMVRREIRLALAAQDLE